MSDALTSVRDGLKHVLGDQHRSWRELIDGLGADALNWAPGPETNSIAVLVTHALGAEESLLSTAVGQQIDRNRAAEFEASAPGAASLLQRIDAADTRIVALLDRLSEADLAEVRQPEGDRLNRRFPGIWWLLHAVEHSNEHLGQASLTRQLFEQRQAGS